MKLGIMAFDTQTGLGYQTLNYYNHLKPDKVMVSDLTEFNGMPLQGWYDRPLIVKGYPQAVDMMAFLDGLDVVLFAETPLNYEFYAIARHMGVKTATVINYEFFDHYLSDHPLPDMFIMPTTWHLKDIQKFGAQNNVRVEMLYNPVDRTQFPYRQRKTKKILHIAGKPAAHDRNGTWDFMQAVPDGRVVTQDEDLAKRIRQRYRHSNVFTGIDDPNRMYDLGDIMILPRRYGGNCLPMFEALSTGMPVIMPNIEPNKDILPAHWLVKADPVSHFTPRTKITLWSVDREAMRQKVQDIQHWDMKEQSALADKLAEELSWNTLKHKFNDILESL